MWSLSKLWDHTVSISVMLIHSNTSMHWHTWESHPCIRPLLPRLWQDGELKESKGLHWRPTSCGKHNDVETDKTQRRWNDSFIQVKGNLIATSHPVFACLNESGTMFVCLRAYRTQVVVLGDSLPSSGARSLLGKMVAKLHDAVVLFQHFSNLHLYSSTQLLPLKETHTHQNLTLG